MIVLTAVTRGVSSSSSSPVMENAAQAAMGTQVRSQAVPANSKLLVTQLNSLLDSDSLPDKDFFYEPLFLKVSNRLFCIPREHLDVPGTAFGLMFADGTPSTSPNGTEGSHQGNPIILEGIDLEEFRGFLKAVWRRDRYPLVTEDWKNALGLAIQWEFEEIKIEAQTNIFSALNKDPFEMIQLGRKFKIRSWILRGYSILVDLSFMLSAEEMIERDMRSELPRIWKIREALRYFSHLANPAALSGLHPQSTASGPFECFSCRSPQPSRNCWGANITWHKKNCGGDITWCSCGKTVWGHRGSGLSADAMGKALIEEIFEDEFELYTE